MADHDDARGNVRQAHGGVGRVDALPALAGGAVNVDADLVLGNLDHDLVGDFRGHACPVAFGGLGAELETGVAPAVRIEHAFVGAGRGVKRDLLPHRTFGFFNLITSSAASDEGAGEEREVFTLTPGLSQALVQVGQDGLVNIFGRVKAVDVESFAQLTGQLGDEGVQARNVDGNLGVLDRPGAV